MNNNVREDSPLLRAQRSRADDSGAAAARLSNQLKMAILLALLFSFYGYVLYETPSRAPTTSATPSVHPTYSPTQAPSFRPVEAKRSQPPAHKHHKQSGKGGDGPAASPNQKPERTHAPTVAPTAAKRTRAVCRNTESFQESAARMVYPTFAALNFKVRATIELLKNKLGTYSFAYFPLKTGKLSFVTWTVEGMDLSDSPPPPAPGVVETADPMEILIYYIDSIYTAVGDLADSESGVDPLKVFRMQQLVLNLTNSWNETIHKDIEPGLSWKTYLMYPGPQGRLWPDGTIVTWANESVFRHLPIALYLEPNGRMTDDQLWGEHKPEQGASGSGAIESLIRIQVKETVRRYQDLLSLDPTGNKDWATFEILSTNNGILTYHKVRKVLRMIGLTIDGFPDVISAFYDTIPFNVIQFVNENFNASIKSGIPVAYGDTFGFSFDGTPITFTKSNYWFNNPLVSVGTMIFANLTEFDALFFGVDDTDLDTLRIILMIKAYRLGELLVLPNSTGCPSLDASYHLAMNPTKKKSLQNDPFTLSSNWMQPQLSHNGYSILGTVCNIDDYFGDIHDLLVKYQQNSTIADKTFMDYTVQVAQGLQQFLRTLDLPHALESNLLNGLCRDKK